jgi:hypothetical protein
MGILRSLFGSRPPAAGQSTGHAPPPEVRPEATEETDEATREIFNHMRDLAYEFKEHLGFEWQHLLPGIQKVCVIYTIKFEGKAGALEIFRDQVRQLQPLLDDYPKNPPQRHPITPLHITYMVKFNEILIGLAEKCIEVQRHPAQIARALSMLGFKLATAHYDLIFLSAIIASSCMDIEQGEYDFVKKTH